MAFRRAENVSLMETRGSPATPQQGPVDLVAKWRAGLAVTATKARAAQKVRAAAPKTPFVPSKASNRRARKRRRTQTFGEGMAVVGQAVKAIVTRPAETSMALGVPVMGGVGSALRVAGARGVLATLERNIPPGAIARIARVGGAAALGAATSEAVDWFQNFQQGRGPGAGGVLTRQTPAAPSGGRPVTMQPRAPLGQLAQGQEFPGGPFVVKSWDTFPGAGVTGGGQWPIFSLLSDGRIVVQKTNGQWRVYRPKKNLVISSNPRLRDIRKLDRMHKKVVKMMRSIVPKTAARRHSKRHD